MTKLAPNRAAFYSVQVFGTRKKLVQESTTHGHMLKNPAQISSTSFWCQKRACVTHVTAAMFCNTKYSI